MRNGFYTVATLENGQKIERNLKVGDIIPTQWGPRKVIKVERKPIESPASDSWDNHCQ